MNKPLTIKVNGVGPVLIEHSRRAKHISVSIKASRGVTVAVPLGVSFDKALEFVRLKQPWIKKHYPEVTAPIWQIGSSPCCLKNFPIESAASDRRRIS